MRGFQVAILMRWGRGGRALLAQNRSRGLGIRSPHRSNFFTTSKIPGAPGSNTYSDMDYIDDHSLWTPTKYEKADSLASWGPPLPPDFVTR